MPPRAQPGDAEAIERALSPTLRLALRELIDLFEIHPDGWQATGIAPPFQAAAVLLEAARIIREEGGGERDAIQEAAARLGVSPETQLSRGDRWWKQSRR